MPTTAGSFPGCSTRTSTVSEDKATLENLPQTAVVPMRVATIVSPSSSKTEMIDLFPQERYVSSNQVAFFLELAKQFTIKKDLPMALEYYSRALRTVNKVAAKSETEQLLMSDVLFEIGRIHMKLKDPAKSLVVFDLCYGIRQQLLDWTDKKNAVVLQHQAHLCGLLGDSESAVQVLEELLGILCCVEEDAKTLRETWLELARHQEILGMDAEAISSREEASQLP